MSDQIQIDIQNANSKGGVVIHPTQIASRVFLMQAEQNVDVTSAMEYGPLIPLFKPNEPKENRPSIWREEFVDEVINRMIKNKFNPEKDYVLVAGYTSGLIIWIVSILREWEDCDVIKFLMWNGKSRNYILMEM